MSPTCLLGIPRQLTVTGLGQARRNIHMDRVLDNWVLVLPFRGRMPMQVGEAVFTAQPGEYFLLPPFVRHRGTACSPYESNWWHFQTPATSPQEYRLPVHGSVPGDLDINGIQLASMHLYQEQVDPWWVEAQLHAVLSRLCSDNLHTVDDKPRRLARDIQTFLFEHRDRDWDRRAIERRFCRTLGYLNRVFRQAYGTSMRSRHLELRVSYAADLLRNGATIAEAADQAGFRDYFNFIRRFRQVKGRSPGRYGAVSRPGGA